MKSKKWAETNLLYEPHSIKLVFYLEPLIQTRTYEGGRSVPAAGSCPLQSAHEDITVDVLQLLSSEFGVRPLGLIRAYPAESCDQVAAANPGSPAGLYWISSDGNIVQVHCQF